MYSLINTVEISGENIIGFEMITSNYCKVFTFNKNTLNRNTFFIGSMDSSNLYTPFIRDLMRQYNEENRL